MATEQREWNRRVDELLQAGKRAYTEGDSRRAHDLWREAATLDPYDERVWLALFRVLETPEALNAKARRQLRAYQTAAEREAHIQERLRLQAEARRKRSRRAMRRSIITGILAGLGGVILGIIASIVVYGYRLIPLPALF
jgi:hypothetical protein